MVLWVVDAHCTYQAGLNVESLAREGYSALIVKASQGWTGYTAPSTFDSWIARARNAGLIPGAYHWLTNADPIGQLDHFLNRLAAVGGPGGMLIGLDVEDTSSPSSAATVATWINEWNRRTGNHPLLFYSGAWWYTAHLGAWAVANLGVHSWNSRYVSGSGYASALYAGVPAGWWNPGYGGFTESTLLQFSADVTAGGIVANVDASAFQGTREQLLALTTTGEGITPMTFSQAQLETQSYNAQNLAQCVVSLDDPAYMLPDGKPAANGIPIENRLAQKLTAILAAVQAGSQPMSPEQFQLLLGDMRAAAESGARQGAAKALEPFATALGTLGDALSPGALALGKLNDTPSA